VSADPAVVLDEVWRREWGRLLALLVAQYRRLELAEDGLADAFEAAARTWPAGGVPDHPPAWLLTAARRRVLDRLRAEAVAARRLPVLAVEAELTAQAQQVRADDGEPVVDERLRLVLLCASPRLAPAAAAALTLRLVLGVATEDIARLFLVSTPTMAARLTRARKRLAGEAFTVPDGPELQERLGVVADVAYLAFTAGYAPTSGSAAVRPELAAEAIRLLRLVRELVPPGSPGTDDLDARLALVLLQHARREARVVDGRLVLLPDQDRSRWRVEEAAEALRLLLPQVHAPPRPALLEALIAAEHAVARTAADTDWARIAARYAELEALTGSPVVRLNRAVAVAEADGPLAGLALLSDLDLPGHRLPATRAELLARAGRPAQASAAYTEALTRCHNDAERDHLERRRAEVG
jgi:RNA polymerase sigma factor (sigma-70 family)